MDFRKYKLGIVCLSLFPLSVSGQEWSKKDSLKLKDFLETNQEIIIDRALIMEIEHGIHRTKSFIEFDSTLPTLKLPINRFYWRTSSEVNLYLTNSTYLPTYSWKRLYKNLILQSKSNFAETSNYFHIHTIMEYKLPNRWAFSLYGTQNLNNRRYRGLSSEIEPTALGSNISLKINKHWNIKAGIQYQYNIIRKKWEWVPQCSIMCEW